MQMYSSLWVWIIIMSLITCAIAIERAIGSPEMMQDECGEALIVAKVCGRSGNATTTLL